MTASPALHTQLDLELGLAALSVTWPDSTTVAGALGELDLEWVTDERHRATIATIRQLLAAGRPIDMSVLGAALVDAGHDWGPPHIVDLLNHAPDRDPAVARGYVEALRARHAAAKARRAEDAERHRIRQVLAEAEKSLGDGTPPAAVVARLRDRSGELADEPAHRDSQPRVLGTHAELSVARFLSADPPPMEWLVRDLIPAGISAGIAGMGGTLKSLFTLQLGASIAGQVPFLGYDIDAPGGCLVLATEDRDEELHRRIHRLFRTAPYAHADRKQVAHYFLATSLVGLETLLTRADGGGEAHETEMVERIIATAMVVPELRYIALDNKSMMMGGEANAEGPSTAFVRAMNRIQKETGAFVFTVAHANKGAIREGGGQELARGSSAFVDGIRWMATMQRMRQDEATKLGIRDDEAMNYVRFDVPKSNYTAPIPTKWLRWSHGVLFPTDLAADVEARRREEAHRVYLAFWKEAQAIINEFGPMSETALRRDFGGLEGRLGTSHDRIRELIPRAERDGHLRRVPAESGNGHLLDLPEAAP